MPPHRRRPNPSTGQAPPIRRPRVAGLRNRQGHQEDPAAAPAAQPAGEQDEAGVTGVPDGVPSEAPPTGEKPPEPAEPAEPDDDDADDDAGLLGDPDEDTAGDTDEDNTGSDQDTDGDKVPVTPRPVPRAGSRPAGKRRATGAARPDDLASAETGTKARSVASRADDAPRGRDQRLIPVAVVLAVVAVVLAGLAVFFRGQANDLTSGDTNTALTDSATTSQVKGQLTNAIKQTFSYNYTDLDSTEKAVRENLTGKALCEYNLLFGEVKRYAPQQKIVLDTTVRELAVVRIDGDRAEALVYIDQLSTRVDVDKTIAVGGQFAVQAARDGDHWKITEFDMFGQPLFNGKPAPKC